MKELRIPGQAPPAPQTKASLTIDLDTAELIRRVCKADGLPLTELLDRMLRAYLAKVHPDWELVEAREPPPVVRTPVTRKSVGTVRTKSKR